MTCKTLCDEKPTHEMEQLSWEGEAIRWGAYREPYLIKRLDLAAEAGTAVDCPWGTRTDVGGTRWNFSCQEHPHACLYSPDPGKPLLDNEYLWVLRHQDQSGDQDVMEWLAQRVDKWIKK